MTAKDFIESLDIIKLEYDKAIPKREIFSLAKASLMMPVVEVVKLIQNKNEDHKLGGVSILDWKARSKKTSEKEKQECYNAYVNNYKWIDNWGLVDRAAPYVVGGYLYDKSRKPLYGMAQSLNPMERRTAIVSTYYFIRKNDIDHTFKIAEMLIHDSDRSVQTAVGSWIREAGKKNINKLKHLLDKYAATMPRITLRYAIEKLDLKTKDYYLNLKKTN